MRFFFVVLLLVGACLAALLSAAAGGASAGVVGSLFAGMGLLMWAEAFVVDLLWDA